MSGSEMSHPETRQRPSRLAAMSGVRARAIFAAAVIAALVVLPGCGGSGGEGGIPQEVADQMLATAQEIETANEDGDCQTAQASTTELRNQAAEVEVAETKRALDAMITRLDENIDADCTESGTTDTEEKPEPEEETTEPAPVEPTTTTTTTPTETVPPEEEEEPSVPEQPPSEGGGPNGPPQTPPGQSGGNPGGGGTAPPTGGVDEG
jgi:hypothetical protein